MLQSIWEQFQAVLGLGRDVADVGALQMVLRTIVVYVFSLLIVQLGSKRFLSRASAFDVVVGIMLGSIMSRAINGSAPLLPTLAGGAMLVGLHWLLAVLAYHTDWIGPLVKGSRVALIEDGHVRPEGMRRAGLSDHDLRQALRIHNEDPDPAKVRFAYLERNGTISVIPFKARPQVLDVAVEKGVQTIRIELG